MKIIPVDLDTRDEKDCVVLNAAYKFNKDERIFVENKDLVVKATVIGLCSDGKIRAQMDWNSLRFKSRFE